MRRTLIPHGPSGMDVEIWRGRELEVAGEHFRRISFQKTTMADIATILEMSRTDIYRFFPSMMAINAAVCARFFNDYSDVARSTARIQGSAQTKLVETLTRRHQKRKASFLEKSVHEMQI